MWRRTLNNWGYSPLDQINRRNVKELRLVWTRPLTNGDQEGTPLVHDGIMFFPNPNDVTQAFDADDGRPALGVPPTGAATTSASTSRLPPRTATSRSTTT